MYTLSIDLLCVCCSNIWTFTVALFLQVLDLKKVELVYNSSLFKSIETGGNVSKALVSFSY